MDLIGRMVQLSPASALHSWGLCRVKGAPGTGGLNNHRASQEFDLAADPLCGR